MFTLSSYLIQVKDPKKILQDLNNINGISIIDYLDNYFQKKKSLPFENKDDEGKKLIILHKILNKEQNKIFFLYKSGLYGFESEIYNPITKNKSYSRSVEEADLIPFVSSALISKDKECYRGIMVFTKFNTQGIKGVATKDLIEDFQKTFPTLTLSVEKYIPDSIFKKIFSEYKPKSIKLTKRSIPEDATDFLSAKDKEKVLDFEWTLKARPGMFFDDVNWIIDLINKKTTINDYFTIEEFKPDTIKVEFSSKGKTRTINLGNFDALIPTIDLDHLPLYTNGHLEHKSLIKEIEEITNDIFLSWGIDAKSS